jgi:alcohol dehydrogenase class IV
VTDESASGRVVDRYRFDTDVVLGEGILAAEVAAFLRAEERPARVVVGPGRTEMVEHHLGPQVHGLSYRIAEIPRTNSFEELADWASGVSDDACFVVVGGAAVLDLAKLLTVRGHDGPLVATTESREEFEAALAGPHLRARSLVAPTVVGSGAETSSLSDVLLDAHQVRSPIISRSLVPDRVVVDAALLANGAPGPQGAAIFDCLMHIIDPWVNSIGLRVLQETTSTSLVSEVLRHARNGAARDLSPDEQLDLARLSHLCLRPGLARIGTHASSIHRIEHALPPRFAASHGEGLAWVAVRFFSWLERHRSAAAQAISVPLADAWGERRLPSRLVLDTAGQLGLRVSHELPPGELDSVVSRCLRSFATGGALPGTLNLDERAVSEILATEPDGPRSAATFLSSFPANEKRVLGLTILEPRATVVVTPIRAVFEALCGPAGRDSAPAWFPSAPISVGGGPALCLLTPVGASATVDALDLVTSTSIAPPLIVFAGLAARLDTTLSLGAVYEATEVLDGSGRVTYLTSTSERHLRVSSARSLSEESDDLLAFFRLHEVSALDLESATFARWCADRGQRSRVVLAISDDMAGAPVRPIWEQQSENGNQLVATCARAVATRTQQLLELGNGQP